MARTRTTKGALIAAKLRGIKRSDETNNRHSHGQACNPREVLTDKPVLTAHRTRFIRSSRRGSRHA